MCVRGQRKAVRMGVECRVTTATRMTVVALDSRWLVLVLALAFGSVPMDARGQSADLRGIVVDSLTKEVLPNVSLVLHGSSYGALTNAFGRFSLVGLPDDRFFYELNVSAYNAYGHDNVWYRKFDLSEDAVVWGRRLRRAGRLWPGWTSLRRCDRDPHPRRVEDHLGLGSHTDALLGEPALADFESEHCGAGAVMELLCLGLHLLDVHDAEAHIEVGDVQRDVGVLHPERSRRLTLEDEEHAGAVRDVVTELQPAATFRGRIHNLGNDCVGPEHDYGHVRTWFENRR